jgi:hypothetical protein
MRRLLALTVPAALVLAAPVGAAPVETSRAAQVRLVLPAAGGEAHVALQAVSRASGDRLLVTVERCDAAGCSAPRYYSAALPAGGLSVDDAEARATLEATVAGLPVRVAWVPAADQGVVVGGLRGSGRGDSNAVALYNGRPAEVAVSMGAASCRGTGDVGDLLEASTSGASAPADQPLSRLRLRAPGTVACGG